MKMITKLIIIIALIVLAVIATAFIYFKYVSYPRDKTGMVNRYKVICNESEFTAERSDYMYEPGDNVTLIFSMIATDTNYSFKVEGVDDYSVDYYEDKGFLIQFIMPHSDVKVTHTEKNTMEREFPDEPDEITISFPENPSTPLHWLYKVEPEGILEVVDDIYVSKQNTSSEPVDGLGGTHFWKFKIVGDGVVELRFYDTDYEEINDMDEEYEKATIFLYECIDGKANLLEKYKEE